MAYTLHTIKPAKGSRTGRRRIGRGNASGMGTYSTRGMKGQRARSGGRSGLKKLASKRILAALPKLGGFRSLKIKPEAVTLLVLDRVFKEGDVVTIQALKENGLVSEKARRAKVIGNTAMKKKLVISGLSISISAGAKKSLEEAGGGVKARP